MAFVRTNIVVGQDLLDLLEALFDVFFVTGRAFAAKQVFENENRDLWPFLSEFGEILADHLARKVAEKQFVEAGVVDGFRSHR